MKAWLVLAITAIVVIVLIALALRDDDMSPLPAAAPAIIEQPAAPPRIVQAPSPVVVTPPVAEELPAEAPAGPEKLNDLGLMSLLRDHGFGKLESAWRDWALSRGYPAVDGSGVSLYDQPYEQYDDVTLRGMADNGDMWAAQILAKRIALTNPADALELYRKAAVAGSVFAMNEMAALYGRVGDKRREVDFKADNQALEQVYAMRDSPLKPDVVGYAWTAVAEMAGSEPMFGTIASSQLSKRLSDEQVEEACTLARGIYEDLRSQRDTRGLGDFERTPPPLVFSDPNSGSSCNDSNSPGLDLSGCREMTVQSQGQDNTVWVCAEDGS